MKHVHQLQMFRPPKSKEGLFNFVRNGRRQVIKNGQNFMNFEDKYHDVNDIKYWAKDVSYKSNLLSLLYSQHEDRKFNIMLYDTVEYWIEYYRLFGMRKYRVFLKDDIFGFGMLLFGSYLAIFLLL